MIDLARHIFIWSSMITVIITLVWCCLPIRESKLSKEIKEEMVWSHIESLWEKRYGYSLRFYLN